MLKCLKKEGLCCNLLISIFIKDSIRQLSKLQQQSIRIPRAETLSLLLIAPAPAQIPVTTWAVNSPGRVLTEKTRCVVLISRTERRSLLMKEESSKFWMISNVKCTFTTIRDSNNFKFSFNFPTYISFLTHQLMPNFERLL